VREPVGTSWIDSRDDVVAIVISEHFDDGVIHEDSEARGSSTHRGRDKGAVSV